MLERMTSYATQVIQGEIPGGKYVRLACQRFLADIERDDLEFREGQAKRAVRFIEALPHVKGKWSSKRENLILSEWQVFIVGNIFGWYQDRVRRFIEAYCEIPRKNGKSTLAAGIGLYMLCEADEDGAEVYSGATSERQAWEIFRPMRQMAMRNEDLANHYGLKIPAKSIYIPDTASRAEPGLIRRRAVCSRPYNVCLSVKPFRNSSYP